MERQALVGAYAEQLQGFDAEHLDQVLGQGADALGLLGIGRVMRQQVAIIFDEGAATAGGLHNGFGAQFDGRPPGIDVLPGALQALLLGIEVVVHGTAATGLMDRRDADTQAIEHPRRGSVGIGCQARLHTAL
ncbi:hypothetical protein D3C80_1767690 [compost metagenome]